jgi:hypothetical protein
VTAGIVVFAHGSRVESANEAVRRVAAAAAREGAFEHVVAAFLELGQPDLAGAVELLAARGVRRVLVTPYFLTDGTQMATLPWPVSWPIARAKDSPAGTRDCRNRTGSAGGGHRPR